MVYCGPPSKGCEGCRDRKIRCDKLKPSCSQCKKVDKICEYRNLLDLSFRNESNHVIQKAKAKDKPKSRQGSRVVKPRTSSTRVSTAASHVSSPTSSRGAKDWALVAYSASSSSSTSTSPSSWSQESLEYHESSLYAIADYVLAPSSGELATGYFVSNFVTQRSGPSKGTWSFIDDFSQSNGGLGEMVTTSMKAVGLAGISNQVKSPLLMRQARNEYVQAIRNINIALSSEKEAKKDVTLLSIMILSLYETITASQPKSSPGLSLKAWTEHLNGAATLVRLRGFAQLNTLIGRGLFMQVLSHLVVSCVQREIPIPADLIKLRAEARSFIDIYEPAWQSLDSIIDFTNYRAALRNGTLTTHEEVIEAALKIDGELAAKFSSLPADWQYETIYTDAMPKIAYNGSYDLYWDSWVAQVYNGMRTCRILLNETVRERLLEGFSESPPLFTDAKYTTQLQQSTDILIQMRDDILHTIPQHLGFVTRNPLGGLSTSDIPSFSPSSTTQQPFFRASGGYFLLWPLFVAGVTKVSCPETRLFVIEKLRFIDEVMGVKQAMALALFLESQQAVNLAMREWNSGCGLGHMMGGWEKE